MKGTHTFAPMRTCMGCLFHTPKNGLHSIFKCDLVPGVERGFGGESEVRIGGIKR